ncbi:MAG: hypothetical protein KDC44_24235 [Phaeodactylibacter sp.]|nr:hypothetical protein [Phaeodactylibacter sp.]
MLLALVQCTPKTGEQSQDSTTIEDRPQPTACIDRTDPMEIEWMEAAVKRHTPYQVYKYRYLTDGWAYYYLGAKESYLYDCQGLLLCSVPGKMMNDCARKVQNLGEGELIYSKE